MIRIIFWVNTCSSNRITCEFDVYEISISFLRNEIMYYVVNILYTEHKSKKKEGNITVWTRCSPVSRDKIFKVVTIRLIYKTLHSTSAHIVSWITRKAYLQIFLFMGVPHKKRLKAQGLLNLFHAYARQFTFIFFVFTIFGCFIISIFFSLDIVFCVVFIYIFFKFSVDWRCDRRQRKYAVL